MGFTQNSTFGFGSNGDITGGTVTGANNGLSLVGGTTVVLGQNVGEVGNPAALLSNRQLPMGSFAIQLTGPDAQHYLNINDVGGDGTMVVGGNVFITGTPNSNEIPALRITQTYQGNDAPFVYAQQINALAAVGTGASLWGIQATIANSQAGAGLTTGVDFTVTNTLATGVITGGAFTVQNSGTGVTRGVLGSAAIVEATSTENAYGIYGNASTTGTGIALAGAFQAPVMVSANDVDFSSLAANVMFDVRGNVSFAKTSVASVVADTRALSVSNAGTHDTTAGVHTNYAGYFSNTATRSAGANALTNYGLYVTSSGAQNNFAAYFDAGNIGMGVASPAAKLHVSTTIRVGQTGSNGTVELARTSDGVVVGTITVSTNPIFNSATGSLDLQSAGTTRLRVGTNGIFIGSSGTATARLELLGGGSGANAAPMKLNSGTLQATPELGAIEYNGTNLSFVRTGTTRETVWVGNSGAAAPGTTAGTTIVNFYGTDDANFLGDPNSWASVVIGGTTFKIPLYT